MTTSPYGIGALTGELKKLASAVPGERNNTLNTTGFKVFQLVHAGHVDEDEAIRRLTETARFIGLPDDEITATIASSRNGAAGKARGNLPLPTGGALPTPPLPVDTETSTEPEVDYYRVRKQLADLPKPQPLLEGVIDEHTLFAITGRDRSYKSFLALDWLACLATGKPWLGRHEVHQCSVLYVVGEGAYGLDARLTAWETAWQQTIPDSFHVRIAPVNLFKRGADVADLYERIEREQYGAIIFDTLQRMTSGADSNHARDAGMIIDTMDALRRANQKAAIGIVAHTGKSDDDTRGSSAFEDDLDAIWRVKRDDDSEMIHIEFAKRKDGQEGANYDLVPRPQPGTDSIILGLSVGRPETGSHPKLAEPILVVLGGPAVPDEGLSFTRLKGITGGSDGAVNRALTWLIGEKFVIREGAGKSTRYQITDSGSLRLQQTRPDQGR